MACNFNVSIGEVDEADTTLLEKFQAQERSYLKKDVDTCEE